MTVPDIIDGLATENAALRARVAELEGCIQRRENDAAALPEDFSITEIVVRLSARVARLRVALQEIRVSVRFSNTDVAADVDNRAFRALEDDK